MKTQYLSHNLKIIRTRWRLNQEELAELIGLKSKGSKAAVISNWERGINTPGLDYILLLQDLTHLDLNRLIKTELRSSDIPLQPILERPYSLSPEAAPDILHESKGAYDNLYDYHQLVAMVKTLEQRIKQLEQNNEQ